MVDHRRHEATILRSFVQKDVVSDVHEEILTFVKVIYRHRKCVCIL